MVYQSLLQQNSCQVVLLLPLIIVVIAWFGVYLSFVTAQVRCIGSGARFWLA